MSEWKPWDLIKEQDPEVFSLIEKELDRQEEGLELIASENFASPAVVATAGSILTNKYAEGLPDKRYYGGCEWVDKIEQLAIDRVCKLFSCSHANVQPHSGAQANAAVFFALAEAGDRILGLDLSHGGHLTHGSKVNFSGKLYESHFYQVTDDSETIDYDRLHKEAIRVNPKIIIAGASAYPRQLDYEAFRKVADDVGAYLVVDMAHIAGLVAVGLHPSPFPHAHVVTSTTHKSLRGPRGGIILWDDEALTKEINKAVFPGMQGGPLEHIIAAKAVSFQEALGSDFKNYQQQVIENAQALAKGLIDEDFKLVSGGTDTHLILVDLSNKDISGKELQELLDRVHITANRNTVPKETRSPFVTSGLRLGTPAVTTRGFKSKQMLEIAKLIADCLNHREDDKALENIATQVKGLAKSFPLYPLWRD